MKEALKVMASTIDEALGQELASQMEQAVEEGVESMRAGMARTNMPESVLVMRRKIEKSAGDMASLLQSVDSKWKEHTGLCKAVAPAKGNEPGATVWCLPELAPIVEEHGVTDDIMDILRESKCGGRNPSSSGVVSRRLVDGKGRAETGATRTCVGHDALPLVDAHQALDPPRSFNDPLSSGVSTHDEGSSRAVAGIGDDSGELSAGVGVWRAMAEMKDEMETQRAQHAIQAEQLKSHIAELDRTINQMSGQQGAWYCSIQ
mmetsp:Transcript_3406/g.6218  ORF Transcript_3406/g.6218 Transcript_3406/m.6218 type:complete len:261 (-) Transcript_3406:157-939(-)